MFNFLTCIFVALDISIKIRKRRKEEEIRQLLFRTQENNINIYLVIK